MPELLAAAFHPVGFEVTLPKRAAKALELATDELTMKALTDPNHCKGYYPDLQPADDALPDLEAIDHNLPQCQDLRERWPAVIGAGRWLEHNFFRLALADQSGTGELLHLDGDAAGRVRVHPDYAESTVVWRALGNLHTELPRTLSYLDRQPTVDDLRDPEQQFLGPTDYERDAIRQVTLDPRDGDTISFVAFPANRMWHTGGTGRHFVVGFGCEEPARV